MTQRDDEWLVDVEGPNVVVTVKSGSQTERRVLTQHQVRALREQLRLADLLARRNRWASGAVPSPIEDAAGDFLVSGVRVQPATLDGPAPRPTVPADENADGGKLLEQLREERGQAVDGGEDDAEAAAAARRREIIRLTSGALDMRGDGDDVWVKSTWKRNPFDRWEIRSDAISISFYVPLRAVGGELFLTDSEALAVGVLLIQLSQREWTKEERLDGSWLRELQSRLLRATRFEELVEVLIRIETEQNRADDGGDAK